MHIYIQTVYTVLQWRCKSPIPFNMCNAFNGDGLCVYMQSCYKKAMFCMYIYIKRAHCVRLYANISDGSSCVVI